MKANSIGYKIGYYIGKGIVWIILGFIAYWIIWGIATIGQYINEVKIK
jgi:hypothetical protein